MPNALKRLTAAREIRKLSADIRGIIDGREVDLRDNREGSLSILKNDIHTLVSLKDEQINALLREKAALKDTLADISHQLKTPLTSMTIMADLLENTLYQAEPAPDKQAEFIRNIKTGLARTEWLVSALLKMAKLDAGAAELTPESIRSDELIALALEPLQILLDIKNQRASVIGGAMLFCDKRWTAEALTNILKNASEHSPEGGELRIEAGENPICAWVSVTDSGTGISNSELAVIFKRFAGSRGKAGYGIGLPLALAIMRGQNGDVQAENAKDGGGARFTLKLYK
jgi:signal transduction histidine kinase